jgi:hypothetical protein
MKRTLVIADLHAGHRAGLTPPGWQYPLDSGDPERQAFALAQRINWEWFARHVDELRPINNLLINGDCLDGKGDRSGGTEHVELDRNKQAEMAIQIIEYIKPEKIVMTYGTAYHTGREEDFEQPIARAVNAKIGGHEWVDIEGVIFDMKHKIGGSQIPHGRYTAVAREALWNLVWAANGGQPKADIILRSHVHYFAHCGNSDTLAIVTPALQGWGSKYGARECSGVVDIGFLHFDIAGKGDYTWHAHILKPKENAVGDMIVKLS